MVEYSRHEKLKRLGSRFGGPAGSLLVHAIIVLALTRWIVHEIPEPAGPGVTVETVEDAPPAIDPPPPEPAVGEDAPPSPPVVSAPKMKMPAPDLESLPAEVSAPSPPVPSASITREVLEESVPAPTRFSGRTEERRKKLLHRHVPEHALSIERALTRALDWLRDRQNADGSWGPVSGAKTRTQERCRLTGLVLMTYLAHGETGSSREYGHAVRDAMMYLLEAQDGSGHFCPVVPFSSPGHADDLGVYGHAIATYALCEAYGLTRAPVLRDPLRKALTVIVEGQQRGGGWDHRYQKAEWSDLSVAGWQVQALCAGRAAGVLVPGLEEALERFPRALAAHHAGEGVFHYRIGIKTPVSHDYMTGVAVVCLQLMGSGGHELAQAGLGHLRRCRISEWDEGWEKVASRRSFNIAYEWYYTTQALFHAGGGPWRDWNKRFAPMLLDAQERDGCWKPPSGDPSGEEIISVTAYSALALQVYYRILPSFQREPSACEHASAWTSEVDVHLD
ncbi:prenyltransferase/squalene oxidase repeat-containing protein [Kiritimatiella glycovorans]|uniref:Squalene cyclase C-terminal domain-containing protein n=1 Tax=Kiritimatiella glycovorans TaxID=1307763 RepID=A0A0G3EF21_9BACT|nr:prenyltransferase/squalene oxidase repeat-containing protein [Kiritimatiella glycovorans]AKJ63365.1 hypothetical protein L21SP4_00078 [Kiritimatiella glycovorans]